MKENEEKKDQNFSTRLTPSDKAKFNDLCDYYEINKAEMESKMIREYHKMTLDRALNQPEEESKRVKIKKMVENLLEEIDKF